MRGRSPSDRARDRTRTGRPGSTGRSCTTAIAWIATIGLSGLPQILIVEWTGMDPQSMRWIWLVLAALFVLTTAIVRRERLGRGSTEPPRHRQRSYSAVGVERAWVAPLAAEQLDGVAALVLVSPGVEFGETFYYELGWRMRDAGFSAAEAERAIDLRRDINAYYRTGDGRAEVVGELETGQDEAWYQTAVDLGLLPTPNRTNKTDGTVRLSAEYDVPTPTGEPDGYIRIRLDQTAEDKITGYNRPEHLRAFPETHEIFNTIQKPLRASAESANRYIDDHHPRERLHHYGFQRNTLSMLGWQAHQNAQTETIFARDPLPHPVPLSPTG